MKLKVSLQLQGGSVHDITLSSDVTATVADAAHVLVRAGATGHRRLQEVARHRLAPLTLRAAPGGTNSFLLLDPQSPLAYSGLQSGWTVEPVLEFSGHADPRVVDVAGYAQVLNGRQKGVQFSLVVGTNLVGRDHKCRLLLLDQSVSRRHLSIHIAALASNSATITDLSSANGSWVVGDGPAHSIEHLEITAPTTIQLGEVKLRVTPGAPAHPPGLHQHRIMHIRVPRVAPSFASTTRELPTPPPRRHAPRLPLTALFAPAMLGVAMYTFTRSPMSLIMTAFSPIMMVGAWLDSRSAAKRASKHGLAIFEQELARERATLEKLRAAEVVAREKETPSIGELHEAIETRNELLWTRRPEHRPFLEVRFGYGSLPSRTRVTLPARSHTTSEQWEALEWLAATFHTVSPVPITERFDRSGAIGVSGARPWSDAMAASIVLQLATLHSPYELVLSCFASHRHAETWGWLKWLPHIDSVASPLAAWQLADDASSSIKLIAALEGLLATRLDGGGAPAQLRSHLTGDAETDEAHRKPVTVLPDTPTVAVLVIEDTLVERARLIDLAERGPNVGIHIIWVARDRTSLPAACRTFVEIDQAAGRVHFVRTGVIVPLTRIEYVEQPVAAKSARTLAPVEDAASRVLDESDLPRSVNLSDLDPSDVLGGATQILASWTKRGSLTAAWTPGADRPQVSLAAVVGQGPDSTAVIDLRLHGPHALVGGTTGAGKSEFLQTWIMSMAAHVSPDRLTFLLVDYKGGAAFAECVDLPHTVGLVTDLSPHLVRRALASLRAEVQYREELLAAHGAKDLISMERRSDAAAPPVLVIVIDEFAALAGEVPTFVDGVIDIAQRGRSLGLHLILATQRPAGVIKDNLRANTNLRIALRMADEADSSDVIGTPDAAFFDPVTPGRGAIKVGPGRISHFQSGYLGSRSMQSSGTPQIEIRTLGFAEGEPWDIPPDLSQPTRLEAGLRDIERLRDGIIEASHLAGLRSPRRPWLDELPRIVSLNELAELQKDRAEASAERPEMARNLPPDATARSPQHPVPWIGLRDDPTAQAQTVVGVDFESVGNLAVFGAGGTGKTSTLITLVAALSERCTDDPVEIYAIDAAGGALETISVLPTVGTVASLNDAELSLRVLRYVRETIAERGPRFAAARVSGLSAYREWSNAMSSRNDLAGSTTDVQTSSACNSRQTVEPRLILCIDGFAAFRQAVETVSGGEQPLSILSEIVALGRAVGVHVVVTSDRPATIPAAMSASLQQQFCLRLTNTGDYGALGVRGDVLESAGPGRAIALHDEREIQFALVCRDGALAAQSAALERRAEALKATGIVPAPRIVNAPERLPRSELPDEFDARPVYGINSRTLDPLSMPTRGLAVLAGPSGSGVSTAALACVDALRRWAAGRGESVDSVLLSFAEDGPLQRCRWSRVASTDSAIDTLARQLVQALGGKPASARSVQFAGGGFGGGLIGDMLNESAAEEAPSRQGALATDDRDAREPQFRFPAQGARGVIVIERPAEGEGSIAISQLVALAKAARRASVLVIFEYEIGTAGAIWELYQALKQPRWGISLQPDDGASQHPFTESLGRVKRADFPPGRGFAFESGTVTPVHVALSEFGESIPDSHRRKEVRYPDGSGPQERAHI